MSDEAIKGTEPKPAAQIAKIDSAAEKAYAEASAKAVEADQAPAATKVASAQKPAPVKAAKPAAKKAASAKKPAAAKRPVAAKKAVAARKPAARKLAAKAAKTISLPASTFTKFKDTIMATAKKTDFTATAKGVAADIQTRVKGAYAKTAEVATDVTEFNKGNVDAVVESGKIFFTGAQELLRDNVETTKTVVETVTADAKKMMEVKSPTDLFQMQGELARRNYDAIVSFGSKRTEAWVKLYNDAFAPISNRASIAVEKITKAA